MRHAPVRSIQAKDTAPLQPGSTTLHTINRCSLGSTTLHTINRCSQAGWLNHYPGRSLYPLQPGQHCYSLVWMDDIRSSRRHRCAFHHPTTPYPHPCSTSTTPWPTRLGFDTTSTRPCHQAGVWHYQHQTLAHQAGFWHCKPCPAASPHPLAPQISSVPCPRAPPQSADATSSFSTMLCAPTCHPKLQPGSAHRHPNATARLCTSHLTATARFCTSPPHSYSQAAQCYATARLCACYATAKRRSPSLPFPLACSATLAGPYLKSGASASTARSCTMLYTASGRPSS